MFDAGKLRSFKSLDAAGRSLRAAEIGRVIECNWTIVAVESLVNRCPGFDSSLG